MFKSVKNKQNQNKNLVIRETLCIVTTNMDLDKQLVLCLYRKRGSDMVSLDRAKSFILIRNT